MSVCVLCSATVDTRSALVWHKDGFDIVRCPSCRLVFRADPPDEQALGDIYDDNYFRDHPEQEDRHGYADYTRDASLHRANARRRLKLLARYARHRGKLLDVGCAAGFFVAEAEGDGWQASGVDVSASMVDYATRRLGVRVARGTFSHISLENASFDAITMWDYIEHSVEPRRDLERAYELLSPGALLALSTGDIGTVTARVTGSRWHLLTPEHHNFFFDTRTLTRLLEGTGFDPVESRHRAGLYSVSHVLYKLGGVGPDIVRRTASRAGQSRLGALGVPLNLFDIVTVIARRR